MFKHNAKKGRLRPIYTTRLRGGGKLAKRQGSFKGEGQEQVSEEIKMVFRYCIDCPPLRVRSTISKLETTAMWMSRIFPFALRDGTSHLLPKLMIKVKFAIEWKEGVSSLSSKRSKSFYLATNFAETISMALTPIKATSQRL
jgi:hypothetical protein